MEGKSLNLGYNSINLILREHIKVFLIINWIVQKEGIKAEIECSVEMQKCETDDQILDYYLLFCEFEPFFFKFFGFCNYIELHYLDEKHED